MRKLIQFLLIVTLASITFSCSSLRNNMKPEEYMKWYVSENFKWKSIDTINGLTYSFNYLPNELEAAHCYLEQCKSRSELKQQLKTNSQVYNFLFEIQTSSWNQNIFEAGRPEFSNSEMVTYLNGQIQFDLKGLSLNNDTLPCTGIIYEPLSSNKIRLIISFEATEPLIGITLNDRIFSGSTQDFAIPELSLKNTPSLKF